VTGPGAAGGGQGATAGQHRCPGPRCPIYIPYELLMCRKHWGQVPAGIKHLVWRTWANGKGAGTDAHNEAMGRAIRAIRHL
jgi:hypothetical protein